MHDAYVEVRIVRDTVAAGRPTKAGARVWVAPLEARRLMASGRARLVDLSALEVIRDAIAARNGGPALTWPRFGQVR